MAQPEVLDAGRIAAQLGAPYLALDAAERARHADLLARLSGPADVVFDVRRASSAAADAWIVTICAADSPGALSLIAGTLTAHGLAVATGDLFTLRSTGSSPERLLLDRFELRAIPGAEQAPWQAVERDLAEVFARLAAGDGDAARDLVIDRVSRAVAPAGEAAHAAAAAMLPVTVDLDDDDPDATTLTIHGADTRGFLFEFANALALLQIAVQRAAVRTEAGETRDTFWVTNRDGTKLSDPARLDELRIVAVLIKQFTHLLPLAPDPALALRQFSALTRGMLARADRRASLAQLADEGVLETLAATLGVSRFLWEDFLRLQHENLFPVLTDRPALDAAKPAAVLREEVRSGVRGGGPPDTEALNAFKDRELFRIDLRHISGRSGFIDFSHELTDLAEVVVGEAAALAERDLQARHGAPRLASGAPCRWTIAALGKFGGRELGFASDLELVTVYEGMGSTDGAESIPNAAYFEQFVRALRAAIRAPRAGIFELDLRLRPHGEGGPLAASLEACRRYYTPGGEARQFERMALVKLRRVAGDGGLGRSLEAVRDAFVYSGATLDFAGLRHLRARQAAELVAPGAINAKHSAGGLVDVEYYVQVRQILAGATKPAVRTSNTLAAIDALARNGHLDFDAATKLPEAYGFLRRLIDALRVVRGNARDLAIPPRESREFAYLARRLYYESSAALATAIEVRMAYAASLWDELPG